MGILADNGIKGAEGGTALRNVILSLTAPTDKAAGLMNELGLEVLDAQGNMRPLNDIFNDLNGTLSTMTQGEQTNVLSNLFNRVDLKSVNALLANSGDRFNELSRYIEDSNGAASGMAETMNDNLNGALKTLSSAFEGVMITIGNAFIPIIRAAAEKLSEFATWFNNANPAIQNTVIAIGTFISILGPSLIILGTLILSISQVVGAFSAFSAALATAGGFSAWFSASLLPVIATIGSVIAIVITFTMAIKENWEELKSATNDLINQCKPYYEQFQLAFKGLWDTCKSIYDTVIQPLFKIIGEIIANCIRNATPILQSLLTVFTMVFNTISSVWNGVGKPVFNFIISIVQSVMMAYQPVFQNMSKLFSSCVSSISSIYNSLLKPAFDSLISIVNKIGQVVSPVFNTIESVITGTFNAILTPINAVIKAFNTLINTVGKVASTVGGTIGKLFGKKSIDVNTNVGTTYSPKTFDTARMDNVALSGSYYSQRSNLVDNFSKLANITNKSISSVGNMNSSGISVNNNLDTTKLEELMANMISILTTQNTLIQANKPVFNLDGQQLSNKLDKISGENMRLYERFNV